MVSATSNGDDPYGKLLPRDASESERLNYQHETLKQILGFVIHPKVLSNLPPDARIADIATGTGIILKDLASTLPKTTRLDGFDLSDSQFPSPAKRPSNVSFHTANAKKPFPTEFHNSFDVVNIRYLAAAMVDFSDWETVTRNVSQLLKPGGYLHWVELDIAQAKNLLRGDISIPISSASAELREATLSIGEQYRYFTFTLGDTFRKVGLQKVEAEIVSTDRLPELRKATWRMSKSPLLQVWEMVERGKKGGLSKEEVATKVKELDQETEAGALYYRYDIHCLSARKA